MRQKCSKCGAIIQIGGDMSDPNTATMLAAEMQKHDATFHVKTISQDIATASVDLLRFSREVFSNFVERYERTGALDISVLEAETLKKAAAKITDLLG